MGVIHDFGMPFTDSSGDRKYSSSAWREYFSSLLENGIIGQEGNELQVKPQTVANKSIYVDTGSIFIEGAIRVLQIAQTLAFSDNTSGNPRIDRVVARLDYTNRKIEFAVLQGTPVANPVAPSLTRNTSLYEMVLADVTLVNGFSTITGAMVTDKRTDEALCGYFKYKAKPAWYPSGSVTKDAYMYLLFRSQLTSQEIADIEANPSLMSIISANSMPLTDTSSYQAFVANVSAVSVECALGKNNETDMPGIGRQLAMYAWYKGDAKATYPFPNLQATKNLLTAAANQSVINEIITSTSLLNFMNAYDYSAGVFEDMIPLTYSGQGCNHLMKYINSSFCIRSSAPVAMTDCCSFTVPKTGIYQVIIPVGGSSDGGTSGTDDYTCRVELQDELGTILLTNTSNYGGVNVFQTLSVVAKLSVGKSYTVKAQKIGSTTSNILSLGVAGAYVYTIKPYKQPVSITSGDEVVQSLVVRDTFGTNSSTAVTKTSSALTVIKAGQYKIMVPVLYQVMRTGAYTITGRILVNGAVVLTDLYQFTVNSKAAMPKSLEFIATLNAGDTVAFQGYGTSYGMAYAESVNLCANTTINQYA